MDEVFSHMSMAVSLCCRIGNSAVIHRTVATKVIRKVQYHCHGVCVTTHLCWTCSELTLCFLRLHLKQARAIRDFRLRLLPLGLALEADVVTYSGEVASIANALCFFHTHTHTFGYSLSSHIDSY